MSSVSAAPYNRHIAKICMSNGAVLSFRIKAIARGMRAPLHQVLAIPRRAQENFAD